MFLVEISLLFLEITGHLLVTYMQNISDCSIREYRSIVATITGHQALSLGLNQGSAYHPTIYTYKDGLFQLC